MTPPTSFLQAARYLALLLLCAPPPILQAQEAQDPSEVSGHVYPLGPLGGLARCPIDQQVLVVTKLEKGAPGKSGGLEVGDRISAANGKLFGTYTANQAEGGQGAPQDLGEAINESLGSLHGDLSLTVQRLGGDTTLTFNLKASETWPPGWMPAYGDRMQDFHEGICTFLYDHLRGRKWLTTGYGDGADRVTTAMAGLALLGSADRKFERMAQEVAHKMVETEPAKIGSNWSLFYQGIFIAEAQLSEPSDSLLTWIEAAVRELESRMGPENGRYGHGGVYPAGSYDGKGLNIVGSGVLWFWALAQECGIRDNSPSFQLNLANLIESTRGSVGYNTWAKGGGDGHGRTAHTLIALNISRQEKAYRNQLLDYLAKHPGSIRENHAYSAPGVMATFISLALQDRREWLRHADMWTWYFTLAQGPDNVAQYIGGKYNNGGDTYLNQRYIMNACLGVIFAIPKGTLHMFGGGPSIPGIAPGTLKGKLKSLYMQLDSAPPADLIRELDAGASKHPELKDKADAMRNYVMEERIRPAWQEVIDRMAAGDFYGGFLHANTFRKECGSPEEFKNDMALCQAVWKLPSVQEGMAIGKNYYTLLDRWSRLPYQRATILRQMQELAESNNGHYPQEAARQLDLWKAEAEARRKGKLRGLGSPALRGEDRFDGFDLH